MNKEDGLDASVRKSMTWLDMRLEARDELLRTARACTKEAGKAIVSIHKGENIEDIHGSYETLRMAYDYMQSVFEAYSPLRGELESSDIFIHAEQEYVEALVFKSVIMEGTVPGMKGICVRPEAYLLGLCDSVGEMRRYVLDSILKNNVNEARRVTNEMERIFDALGSLQYPKSIIDIRYRVDRLRGTLERTKSDLLLKSRD